MSMDVVDANHGIAYQPQQDNGRKGYANNPGAKALNEEQHADDGQGNTHNGACRMCKTRLICAALLTVCIKQYDLLMIQAFSMSRVVHTLLAQKVK